MIDPIKALATPVPEARAQARRFVDEYGEEWVVIDGVETKVPRIAAAKVLLAKQDKVRVEIRAELDRLGARETYETEMEIDGEVVTVQMPTNPNVLQIGGFPDGEGLIKSAEKADADRARDEQRAQIVAALDKHKNQPWFTRLLNGIDTILRKATK